MFKKYLLEIKNRSLLIFSAWFIAIITCYFYKNILLFLLIKFNFKLYDLELFYFITTNLSDVFSVCIQLSYFVSNQLLIFLVCYHFFMFLTPGLFKFEYILIKVSINVGCLLFCLSMLMLHLFILPTLCDFFFNFQINCGVKVFFESKITEYFIFYKNMYFLTMLIGQIFSLIILRLIFSGNKLSFIKKSRKSLYLIFFIFSTFLTPPDIFSQIIIGLCLISFYESFVLCMFMVKNKLM